ncbi:glycoside hydrolase family 2 protein [Microbacterium sp. XT11]|uniref:glycoside hydrolase family 2 protein n=1 Tax=Microbacterium sp. XT11 TaxID=367477 RepID=UPI00082B4913|nr:glycoside hydrolase family 2 [Microbacterium sp. XT11]
MLASPLWGDRAVEMDAAVVSTPASVEAAPAPTSRVVPRWLDLDGDWLMRGAAPAREFSLERWTDDRSERVRRQPVGWHREDTDRSEWIVASVPGTVQGALVAAGAMPDPLLQDNTYRELVEHGTPVERPWFFRRTRVEEQEWWYARRFRVPAEWRDERVRLAFDGIDYAAAVFLNGEPIARHTGMYGGPDVEVTRQLRFDAENEIVVRIDPPPRDWHGVMKPSPGWGWHYGHLISIGIWRSVRLEVIPAVEVEDLFVQTLEAGAERATLRVQWDMRWAEVQEAQEAPVNIVLRDPEGAAVVSVEAHIEGRGHSRHHVDLAVDEPRLWWPFGYGDQPLYTVEVSTRTDAAATTIGIRSVRWLPLAGRSGPDVYDWQFTINGRALFLKGANWCWTDPMARRGVEIDLHLLDLVERANLQMLRAWGGGTVESDAFYAECDRRGILVLQEFPLSFGLDSTGADLATIDEQVSRVVRRLRNHPSLVLWGGGNENPESITSDDLMTVIGKRVAQYDPSRVFHRTDPWGGSEHFYGVYHEGMPVDAYRDHVPVVFGEYGLSSQCDIESMAEFLDPAILEQWPPAEHGAILQHQSQFSLFDLVKQARYADYGPLTDWKTFIEYSQLAQGDALRFASERMRARSGVETAAYWFYKVGDVFPGASWAVIDYYGRPKLSYYRARQFGAPLSVYAVADRTEWRAGERFAASVHVSNDTVEKVTDAVVTARLYDACFRVLAERTALVSVRPDGRADVFDLVADLPDADLAPLVLSVRLDDARGERLDSSWYAFNAHPKSARVRELEALPLDELQALPAAETLAAYAEAGPAPLREQPQTTLVLDLVDGALRIANTGGVPAPVVIIDGFPYAPGRWLEDNAFGLEPGEVRFVRFEAGAADVGGVSVRAWNAPTVRIGL